MKLVYSRKSKNSYKKTLDKLREFSAKAKLLHGEMEINKNMHSFYVCNMKWMEEIVKYELKMIGLSPCQIVVYKEKDDVFVTVGDASLIIDVTQGQNPHLNHVAQEIVEIMKKIIHEAAGVGELKIKEVKLYSTMSCPYCSIEESWLKSKKIDHEKVLIDLNPERAQELVNKTGQMGVPVTEITYEDGDEAEYVVGFDKPKLATILQVAE